MPFNKTVNRDAVISALQHPKGAKLSDRQIAEHVGVSRDMIIRYRHEMESDGTCNKTTSRTGRDGRTINTANIAENGLALQKKLAKERQAQAGKSSAPGKKAEKGKETFPEVSRGQARDIVGKASGGGDRAAGERTAKAQA